MDEVPFEATVAKAAVCVLNTLVSTEAFNDVLSIDGAVAGL